MLSGFLIVNKPAGWTSHDAVAKCRGLLGTKKIGHTGTLDPLATGVLVLGVGQGTKLVEYLVGCDKVYEAELLLGATSATLDTDSELTPIPNAQPVSRGDFETALAGFVGKLNQIPPAYSAIKIGGTPAHRLARAGQEVELKPRPVELISAQLTSFDWPRAGLKITVSSGFYVRSLARDLGAKLGCGAVLSALRRTRVGSFGLEVAVELAAISPEKLLPIEAGIRDLPQLEIGPVAGARLAAGQRIRIQQPDAPAVAVLARGEFIAVGSILDGVLKPEKVLN